MTPCAFWPRYSCSWHLKPSSSFGKKLNAAAVLLLFGLTLALPGCAASAGSGTAGRTLRPAPQTPGAVISEEYICIPLTEAADLLLWIEEAEGR